MTEFCKAGGEHFKLHDLKAKGMSDTDENKRKLAGGHKTDKASQAYQRRFDVTEATR